MFDCGVVACVKLSEIWNFLKVKCEGTKGLSQTFILHSYLHEFKFISLQNPRVKIIWLLPLKKWKGVWKWFKFHLKYFKHRNLKQLNEFRREDKMTSSNLKKQSWKFQTNNLEVTLKLFKTPFPFEVVWKSKFKSSWELFGFLFKLFFS